MSVNDRLIKSELARHEAVIERGMRTTIEVGLSMKAIRDEKLYEGAYKTFENYASERWGYGKSRAYQLIEAAEVDANLSTIVDIDRPQNEGQLREVAKAPPEKRAEVVKKVVETAAKENRKPTAKDYKQVVAELVWEDVEAEDGGETTEAEEKPAPKPSRGKPVQSSAQFCDQVTKQHIGPLARDLLKLAKMTGGQDGQYETAAGHLDEVLQYVKEKRK